MKNFTSFFTNTKNKFGNDSTLLLFDTVLLLLTEMVNAQSVSSYSFATNATGSLIADANGNAITSGGFSATLASGDDAASSVTTIGGSMSFPFNGVSYTQFSVSTNGAVRLGNTAISSGLYGTSAAIPTANMPLLMPYLGDIETSSTGSITWQVVGSSPIRCLVIQFTNMGINYGSTTADGTFQTRLYETSGIVEFVYGAMKVGGTSTGGGSTSVVIGIQNNTGAGNNRTVSQVSPYATTTTAAATINSNTATGNIAGLNSTTDGSRRRFIFSPPACTTPSAPTALNLTAVTGGGSITGTFTAPGTAPSGYLVIRTTSATAP